MKHTLFALSLVLAAAGAQAQVSGGLGGDTGVPYATFGPAHACTAGTPCTLTGTVNSATIVGGTVLTADQSYADIPKFAIGGFLASGPSTTTPATMTFSQAITSIGFLWGSPDTYNTLTVETTAGNKTFTTATLGIVPSNGDQSFSQYVNFVADAGVGLLGLVFASPGQDAFEVANFSRLDTTQLAAAVPEPETYAMLVAGLGVIGFVARRRKSKSLA